MRPCPPLILYSIVSIVSKYSIVSHGGFDHMGIWDMVIWAYGKRNCTLTRRSGEVGGLYYIMVTWAYGHADSHTDMVRHRIDSHMYVW